VLGGGPDGCETDEVADGHLVQAERRVGILQLLAHVEEALGPRGGGVGELRGAGQGVHHPLGDHLADALQRGACAGSGEVRVGSSERRGPDRRLSNRNDRSPSLSCSKAPGALTTQRIRVPLTCWPSTVM